MLEKRKQPRFEENVTITFENATDTQVVGTGLDEMPCLLTELSEGGARIRATQRLPLGTPLLLHLLLEHEGHHDLHEEDDEDTYLQIHAVTRWEPEINADPPYDIGLEFAGIPEDQLDALRAYIIRKVAPTLP